MITSFSRKVNPLNIISCDLQEKLIEARYSPQALFTLLGLLNNYIYIAALNVGAITRDCRRRLVFHARNIEKLFAEGLIVTVPIIELYDNLCKFWDGLAFRSKRSVEKCRQVLSELFKIFTLEDRANWVNPQNRHRQPNPCGNFNMVRALELAHQIELLLKSYGFELEAFELDCRDWGEIYAGNYNYVRVESRSFPKHKGWTLKKLYDMSFGPLGSYWGRNGVGQADAYSEQLTGEPLSEVIEALEKEDAIIQAETRFEKILATEFKREPEEILTTESVKIVETEIVESNGLAVLVDKVIATTPLAKLVRCAMKVPPARHPRPPQENSVSIPCWVLVESEKALKWWEKRLANSGLWLQNFAPSWVWSTLVPF